MIKTITTNGKLLQKLSSGIISATAAEPKINVTATKRGDNNIKKQRFVCLSFMFFISVYFYP
ncbi:MAG: hypothetical protein J1F37_00795, partial [Oscillospiraceae bacterium]|nr:hypothetical protein [Oscillospiraceae bacterium]